MKTHLDERRGNGMKVIVIGCGRMGADLAYRLFKRGHDVAVIDRRDSSFNMLPPDFQGRLYEGEALNQDVLERAGIKTCDALAVVTEGDTLNIVAAHMARTHYKVKNVVARNFDPQYRMLFEAFNLQVVSATGWAAQRVEELLYHADLRTVFSAGNGEIEVYEVTISEDWNNQKLGKLVAGQACLAVSLTRAGRAFLPTAETILETGDVLLVSATLDGVQSIRGRLGLKQEAI
jgi:trk system potassium uptake protein TrkA